MAGTPLPRSPSDPPPLESGVVGMRLSQLRMVAAQPAAEPVAQRGLACVMVGTRLLRQSISRVLRVSGFDVANAVSPGADSGATEEERTPIRRVAERVSEGDVDVLVFDLDMDVDPGERDALLESLERDHRVGAVILVSQRDDRHSLAESFAKAHSANIILVAGELDTAHLLVTARKMLARDIFGIEKYLHWGSIIHSAEITSSEARGPMLDRVEAFLDEMLCSQHMVAKILTVADEFLVNALFDAPLAAGNVVPRIGEGKPVHLPRPVSFYYGSDGRRIVMGCRDPYGSLLVTDVTQALARCLRGGEDQIIDSKVGGAGLGIYMSYNAVDHLVVNVQPGGATEFIGVIEMADLRTRHAHRGRSVTIFSAQGETE